MLTRKYATSKSLKLVESFTAELKRGIEPTLKYFALLELSAFGSNLNLELYMLLELGALLGV